MQGERGRPASSGHDRSARDGSPSDRAAETLLAATESLHAALERDADAGVVAAAWAERERSFEALRAAIELGAAPSAATRARVRRVRALDAKLLALGRARVEGLQDERTLLQRQRSAIRAHAARGRDEPRLIAVKA